MMHESHAFEAHHSVGTPIEAVTCGNKEEQPGEKSAAQRKHASPVISCGIRDTMAGLWKPLLLLIAIAGPLMASPEAQSATTDAVQRKASSWLANQARKPVIVPIKHQSSAPDKTLDGHSRSQSQQQQQQLPVNHPGSRSSNSEQLAEWPFFKSFQVSRSNSFKPREAVEAQDGSSRSVSSGGTGSSQSASSQTRASSSSSRATMMGPAMGEPEEGEGEEQEQEVATTEQSPSTVYESTEAPLASTQTVSPGSAPRQTGSSPAASREPTSKPDPLFSAKLHQSIQEAVDRVVKASNVRPVNMASARGGNSLSLNVLLKNFGVANLTLLDQISLKSAHRNASSQPGSAGSPSIKIQGFQAPVEPLTMVHLEESREAECKIEYTMKHVNISLMNGPRGDYSCDYIIDRKLSANGGRASDSDGVSSNAEKVCRLRLSSSSFANVTEPKPGACNGSSHLAVGQMRFCLLAAADGRKGSLEREFEFPLDWDAFDIKMVHRQQARTSEPEAEIRLEIQPLSEPNCSQPQRLDSLSTAPPSTGASPAIMRDEPAGRKPATAIPVTGISASSTSSRPIGLMDSAGSASRQRRKFVLKVAPERHLHPLNRLKVAAPQSAGPAHRSTPAPAEGAQSQGKLPAGQQGGSPEQPCDQLDHRGPAGQLATPDYPNLYAANTSCVFQVKRLSDAYCQLLLHFRDFDLVQGSAAAELDCSDDYLQIGSTRYCNKYAMIGHKMRLDFPASASLKLLFHADSMRGGRGFLIKYQQLACNKSQPLQPAPISPQSGTGAIYAPPDRAGHRQQAALQQPDFGLGLSTSGASGTSGASSTSAPMIAPSEAPTSSSAAGRQGEPAATNWPMNISSALMASTSSLVASLEPLADCSQVHSEMDFLLRSPNHPAHYPNKLDCLFYVRRNSSEVCYLELTYLSFELEPDQECRYDFLEINGVRLCGSLKDIGHKISRLYQFNQPIKLIRFHSDQSNSAPGFLVRVQQLRCTGRGDRSILRASGPSPADSAPALMPGAAASGQLEAPARITYAPAPPATPPPALAEPAAPAAAPSARPAGQLGPSCDQLLFGRDLAIRSPGWPESYERELPAPATCRYQIMRAAGAEPAQLAQGGQICQLELRFVHLNLGPGDCLQVKGHELLCGLRARNLVNLYPFERQASLSLSFHFRHGQLGHSMAEPDEPDGTPAQPRRFAIVGRQIECRQSEGGAQRAGPASAGGWQEMAALNKSARAYRDQQPGLLSYDQLAPDRSQQPDWWCTEGPGSLQLVGGDELRSAGYASGTGYGRAHCKLELARQSESKCQLELELLDLDLADSAPCRWHYVQFGAHSRHLCQLDQVGPDEFGRRLIRLPFERARHFRVQVTLHTSDQAGAARKGLLARMRQLDCPSGGDEAAGLLGRISWLQPALSEATPKGPKLELSAPSEKAASSLGDEPEAQTVREPARREEQWADCNLELSQLFGSFSSASLLAGRPSWRASQCELRVRLMAGFCSLQLQFPHFRLDQRAPLNGSCSPWSYLELPDGKRYCGHELEDASKLVQQKAVLGARRLLRLRFAGRANSSHAFRASFRQLECQPEPLVEPSSAAPPPPPPPEAPAEPEFEKPGLRLRELTVQGQLFELRRQELAPQENLFAVYRIRKHSRSVCALRLVFLHFRLAASAPACQQSFLDLDNRERLCGPSLAEPVRELSWPGEGDFLLSYVEAGDNRSSPASARGDFHLVGQQLSSNCNSSGAGAAAAASSSSADTQKEPQRRLEPDREWTSGEGGSGQSPAKPRGAPACSQVLREPSFELASPGWPHRYPANASCQYLVERASAEACQVTFQVLWLALRGAERLELPGEPCEPQRADHLWLDGQLLCSGGRSQLVVKFGARNSFGAHFNAPAGAGLGFLMQARQEPCSGQPDEPGRQVQPVQQVQQVQVQSLPAEPQQSQHCEQQLVEAQDASLLESDQFPLGYRANLDCAILMRRANGSVCALELELRHFELEEASRPGGRCDRDYLELEAGSRLCGSYPAGQRVRLAFGPHELSKLARFRSDAAVSRAGFSLLVRQLTDCESDLVSAGGSALAGWSSREPASTLCQFLQRSARAELRSPPAGGGSSIDTECRYRIAAASPQVCALRLHLLSLELEPSDHCRMDYLLIDNRRLCANQTGPNWPMELAFGPNLPRELELRFHASARRPGAAYLVARPHFRLRYEQLECERGAAAPGSPAGPEYPAGYVSEPAGGLTLRAGISVAGAGPPSDT